MAEDAPELTEKEEREKLHRYLDEMYLVMVRVDKTTRGLVRKEEQGERRRDKTGSRESAARSVRQTREGHGQPGTFFTGVVARTEAPHVAPRDASRSGGSLTLIVTAAMTGVLSVTVFLVPNESPWMVLTAGALLLCALVSGALAIRYDRGPASRSLTRRREDAQNRVVVRYGVRSANEVA